MTEVQFSKRVRRADKWSKVVGLFVAMAVFGVSFWLTDASHLSSITAAGAGIGVRFFIPYQTSISIPEAERTSIKEHPGTGNFHHGAVGAALVFGSLITTGIMVVEQNASLALWVGLVATVFLFILFAEALPRG